MNRENCKIKEFGNEYLVETIEGVYFKVKEQTVNQITSYTGANEEDIVILLATIANSRISYGSRHYKELIEERTLVNSITRLLSIYDAEDLILMFGELKYYEIKKVLESENPIVELGKIF